MTVEKWQAGDKITAEKMNRIIDFLNDVEVKLQSVNRAVEEITNKVNNVTTVTDSVKADTNALVEKYNTKLAEVQKAYKNLSDEVTKISKNTKKANTK